MGLDDCNKGDLLWYIKLNELTGTKELKNCKVRSKLPHVLILTDIANNNSYSIDESEACYLFRDESSAKAFFNKIKISGIFGSQQ